MKDTRSTRDNGSILSHISEIDYQLPPTPKFETPLPPILPDLKLAKKKKKPTGYAPPVSGRESWCGVRQLKIHQIQVHMILI